MKKYLLVIILGLFISSVAIARSTGCKEGNCENGFGKWVYTDKTTYEGEWVGTKKNQTFWSCLIHEYIEIYFSAFSLFIFFVISWINSPVFLVIIPDSE